MGTWQFKPFSVFGKVESGGTWESTGAHTDDTHILAAINSTGSGNTIGLITVGGVASGSITFLGKFYLDGSLTPTEFIDLPSGFTILTANLGIKTLVALNSYPDTDYYITGGGTGEMKIPQSASLTYLLSLAGLVPTPLILNTAFTLRVDKNAAGGDQGFYNFLTSGTYVIRDFTYSLDNKSQPIRPGVSRVTITSDPLDSDHLKLNQLDLTTPITITDANSDTIPAPTIISQTEFKLVFLVNSFGGPEPQVITINVTGDGTQFSGSVPLGKLETIYFINAPGIYRIVSGKTNDTLYDVENGGTIDVQIPDPFGKTGFIGG